MQSRPFDAQDWLAINTLRGIAIDAVQKADSGHPGLPLGAAPMAYVLWSRHLKHNPAHPQWADRDRFILSAGHGSMLLYGLLHLFGYPLSMNDVQSFRQLGSKTPGHPEAHFTPGVEATTGPLGQGSANAVGMAIAERKLAHLFNRSNHKVVDHYTYALVSDGDLMEGVAAEAGSLAGQLKLGKLIYLYDANDITLDGPTSLSFSVENVGKRYESYGWQVITVANGDNDLEAIDQAIRQAKSDISRPSLIIVKTTIGFGSPNKAGKSSSHGSPLGVDEVKLTKKALGLDPESNFQIPKEAAERFLSFKLAGSQNEQNWIREFDLYQKENPELAKTWKTCWSGELPAHWSDKLPTFAVGDDSATRASSGKVIQAIAAQFPGFFGGDADLSSSTNTAIKEGGDFEGQSGTGRNIRYGVREHAMAAAANGIAYHGGLRTFTGTFFCFADYMRPSVRLAAMNHLPVVYVWTHDSVGLGEDGPTHQPVEHLASLRCMPGLVTLRPCDANEVTESWKMALSRTQGPTALVLSRQKTKTLDRAIYGSALGVARGAYVLSPETVGAPLDWVIIATGTEVGIALDVQSRLRGVGKNARVVSMPSWELFAQQTLQYRNDVLGPGNVRRAAIEAGSTMGWERWVGQNGHIFGIDRFGLSAPEKQAFDVLGLTAEKIAAQLTAV